MEGKIVQEQQSQWVAIGARQVLEAEEIGTPWAALGSLSLLRTLVRGRCLGVAHADTHVKVMAEAQQQGVNAVIVRSIRRVVSMESQHRASITAQLLALHSILMGGMVGRKALVSEDALRRRTYGAAARRGLACLLSGQDTPRSLAEQSQPLGYPVPVMAAQHFFNPLRPRMHTGRGHPE